ncbi:hypothetical protein [Limnofasciculus baicalensis]|uniref:Uncharacterized protein n=1 Tax=Limnofasciculus baicalensis BBK-W-15 TaxID=2699891 RepID=A0AAE3GXT9_9CYAN|nr:hypothetical protein [Limnofasciculus baicalensis]MCP2732575.1 hypothetical protein [Limnofasciculus baicalensis BBK-W-15]
MAVAIVKDISGNPVQWLSNLGAGATDGIKNHFWGSFQTAVKEWFSQKVEEVLGLGMTVWNVLKQGGINVTEVSKMAWEGIKSAIPAVLISILIEKVVSMIVPAAGTVMLIIEGLQAAWGTASRILQAFERFMAFLKAVKTGQAGPPFGAAVAAAGVVVIDFVANWLLKRLRGAASKVAAKVREIAAKIGSKIKGKLGKVKDKFFGKKKGDKGKGREDNHNRSNEEQELRKREKWQRAFEQARQALRQKLNKGLGRIGFYAVMTWLKLRYGFKKIQVDKSDNQFSVKATFNPTEELVSGKIVTFDYTEEGIIKGSKPYRQGVLNQLGLQHTAKGHDPSIPDQTLANNARMQGGSGKWLSHRAMIEAGKLAKVMYPDPNPGEAYFIPIPPGWAKGYRRVNPSETIEPELYVLQDEGARKPGVIEPTFRTLNCHKGESNQKKGQNS